MEPTRTSINFEPIEDGYVILITSAGPVKASLCKLGNELFAMAGDFNIQLYANGFTSGPHRWEHFPNPPINIICNSLGRMVCQN